MFRAPDNGFAMRARAGSEDEQSPNLIDAAIIAAAGGVRAASASSASHQAASSEYVAGPHVHTLV